MDFDFSKHKEAYITEAKTHVKTLNYALVELEKNPDDIKLFHKIFRATHTLKSLSATMGYEQSMSLCHAIEDILDAIRYEQLSLSICTDLLFKAFDQLSLDLKNLSTNQEEVDSSALIKQVHHLLEKHKAPSIKLSKNQMQLESDAIEKIQSIEVKIEELDILMNLAEEFLVNKMKLESIREQIDHPDLLPVIESLSRLITDLQYHIMQVRLVPIAFVFNRFIRMTRDLAKNQNKEVNLQIEGAEIEFDRSLIDEIAESISHLIRNAIDHGIETPDIRLKMNKPAQGTIWLNVQRTKEAAKIEISDDGAGINLEAIKKLALNHNLIKPGASHAEVLNTIFTGISTAESVTEISGRGLGLSIVKLKIESIGGTIKVNSNPGKGTTFLIEIPLSLAIIKTLFVKTGDEIYAIPTEFVERLLMIDTKNIKGLMKEEAIIFEENDIPLIRLRSIFHQKILPLDKQPIVIIHNGNERLALAVDELLTTKEVIIKQLNRSIKDNKFFSGATLIGSGRMILILDVAYLFQLRKKNASSHGGIINAV
ncbi:MAG: chemotaxis protein CheA [Gammaproteobacteria bacterium]